MNTYEMTWRNNWLTAHATSINQMIESFELAITDLKKFQEDQIEFDFREAKYDLIYLRTSNEEVAKKYGMELLDDELGDL